MLRDLKSFADDDDEEEELSLELFDLSSVGSSWTDVNADVSVKRCHDRIRSYQVSGYSLYFELRLSLWTFRWFQSSDCPRIHYVILRPDDDLTISLWTTKHLCSTMCLSGVSWSADLCILQKTHVNLERTNAYSPELNVRYIAARWPLERLKRWFRVWCLVTIWGLSTVLSSRRVQRIWIIKHERSTRFKNVHKFILMKEELSIVSFILKNILRQNKVIWICTRTSLLEISTSAHWIFRFSGLKSPWHRYRRTAHKTAESSDPDRIQKSCHINYIVWLKLQTLFTDTMTSWSRCIYALFLRKDIDLEDFNRRMTVSSRRCRWRTCQSVNDWRSTSESYVRRFVAHTLRWWRDLERLTLRRHI